MNNWEDAQRKSCFTFFRVFIALCSHAAERRPVKAAAGGDLEHLTQMFASNREQGSRAVEQGELGGAEQIDEVLI